MNPEWIARLVARWVRFYTRDLPEPTARRRIEEVDADVRDQIAHERDDGVGDRRIALHVASRMVRGLAADASWRRRAIARSATKEAVKMGTTARSAIRVALVTTAVLLAPLVAMRFTDEVNWTPFDLAFAFVLLAGAGSLLELALKKPGRPVYRVSATALGVVAIVLGEADDAPGLVLFGLLLIGGTVALTIKRVRRSA